MRIAVLNREICKPNKCASGPNKPCIVNCPRVRTGDKTIELGDDGFPYLTESLCSGEAICVKKCPFGCFQIVNVPDILGKDLTHRYTPDGFSLFRMLIPKRGKVLGVIGQNGIGKSTALKILAGEMMMNLGKFDEEVPSWEEIIKHFRGSELQSYLSDLENKSSKFIYKPQNITDIPKIIEGTVGETLGRIGDKENIDWVTGILNLKNLLDRKVSVLSGGELQRFAIAAAVVREGDCYMFDEPSSYLDVKERLKMAELIRNLASKNKTILIVEHDLAILDYLSDYVSLLYGTPGAFGIISHPHGVRVGINIYLGGYIKDENMRFRAEPIAFHTRPPGETAFTTGNVLFEYPDMKKTLDSFKLSVYGGEIHTGEVIGILGPNGIGKTTFINLIAKKIEPDDAKISTGDLKVALKPQYIFAEENVNVDDIMRSIQMNSNFSSPYKRRIIETLQLDYIKGRNLTELSGGELQKVSIAQCLTTEADIYLLDEPSAFLDVEMRLRAAVLIRKSIEDLKKCAFVVEHDIITQDFISDSLIVFEGKSGENGYSTAPQDLRSGMNSFLKNMDITFRRDPSTGRPRVNKKGSNLDSYQKSIGEYYYIPKKGEE